MVEKPKETTIIAINKLDNEQAKSECKNNCPGCTCTREEPDEWAGSSTAERQLVKTSATTWFSQDEFNRPVRTTVISYYQ